jgi:hypothetical protein
MSDPHDADFTHTDMVVETVAAPLDKVWPVIADFGGIGRYVKGAQVDRVEGVGVGCVRIIAREAGDVREQLTALDEAAHSYSYRVLDSSPVGMKGYSSDVRVIAEGGAACRVEWRGRFATASAKNAEAQKKGLEQFYRNAITGIREIVAAV